MMIKRLLSVLILSQGLFLASTLAAETVLYHPTIFQDSKQQILAMNEPELDELRVYLSSCGTSAGGDVKRFFCERSARSYILKYGHQKPVEQLIMAMAEVEFLIDLVDQADEKGQAPEAMKNQVFRDLDRYIVVRQMMEDAMKNAYKSHQNLAED